MGKKPNIEHFISLPDELWLEVLSHLTAEKLCLVALGSTELYRLATDNMLWKQLVARTFSRLLIMALIAEYYTEATEKPQVNYRKIYREANIIMLNNIHAEHGLAIAKQIFFALSDQNLQDIPKNFLTLLLDIMQQDYRRPVMNLSVIEHALGYLEYQYFDNITNALGNWISNNEKVRAAVKKRLISAGLTNKGEMFYMDFCRLNAADLDNLLQIAENEFNEYFALQLSGNIFSIREMQAVSYKLAQNSKLQSLSLIGDFRSIDLILLLNEFMQKDNNLRYLHCTYNEIGPYAIKRIAEVLVMSNCNLTHINLDYSSLTQGRPLFLDYVEHGYGLNKPDPDEINSLKLLQESLCDPRCKLRSLSLAMHSEACQDIDKVLEAIVTNVNCKLRVFRYSGIGLTSKTCSNIAKGLQCSYSQLRDLNLSSNQIQTDGIVQLCKGLLYNSSRLLIINLSRNTLHRKGMLALVEVLTARTSSLESLLLRECQLQEELVVILAGALNNKSCKLELLDISYNFLNNVGLNALFTKLVDNARLRKLDISQSYSNITDISAVTGFFASKKQRLSHLTFQYGKLQSDCLQQILNSFNNINSQLRYLVMCSEQPTILALDNLCLAIEGGTCMLRYLDMSDCAFFPGEIPKFANYLANNNSMLLVLKLNSCQLSSADVVAIMSALPSKRCKMISLDLGFNAIDDAAIDSIAQAIRHEGYSLPLLYISVEPSLSDRNLRMIANAMVWSEYVNKRKVMVDSDKIVWFYTAARRLYEKEQRRLQSGNSLRVNMR